MPRAHWSSAWSTGSVPLPELRAASLRYAKRLSLISPEALYATKRAVNRGADAAGFRTAIYAGLDVVGPLYATKTEFGTKFREMVAAEPGQKLGDIMTEHVISLPKDATLREAAMLFDRYNFRALPITDENDQLLGAVSSRDVRSLRPRLA